MEGPSKLVVVSAMGSHPSSPVKVTDLLLNMIRKAAARDAAYLAELAALQDKHLSTAALLLDNGTAAGREELERFTAELIADFESVKSILQAIATGAQHECACRLARHTCRETPQAPAHRESFARTHQTSCTPHNGLFPNAQWGLRRRCCPMRWWGTARSGARASLPRTCACRGTTRA